MDTNTSTNRRALADEIVRRLDDSYELIPVQYRDHLNAKQVNALVRGSDADVWEVLDTYTATTRSDSVCHIARELTDTITREWATERATDDLGDLAESFLQSEEYDEVRTAIEERDRSDPVRQLTRQTPAPLLRVRALGEDQGWDCQPVSAQDAAERLNVPPTAENIATLTATLAECAPEHSLLCAFWAFSVDLETIYDLPCEATHIDVADPHVYLGNPLAGSGFLSQAPLNATVRIPRAALRTDADALGYSLEDVYGGLNPSAYAATIRPVSSR